MINGGVDPGGKNRRPVFINQRGKGALRGGSDAIRHIFGRKTLIVPDDADHRNVDLREDVRGSAQNYDRREEQDQECHHDKGVGPP
jgi:hypothetical protein